ncbi:MAG: GAF domain-containing sensor histidine kinase [Anaerolineae bacterium]|nr:GAF domain-containing sensor histidine kinase [Anaerolineae bacterium]MDQ7037094.1 GAF domain-containing sensor histidine kinase [Anaerolineae bacterium]
MIEKLNIGIIFVILFAEVALLGFNLIRRIPDHARTTWLTVTLIPMIVVTALQLLPVDWQVGDRFNRDIFIWATLIVTAIAYGGMVLFDVVRDERLEKLRQIWIGLSIIWLLGFVLTALLTTPPFAGWTTWSTDFPLIPAVISVISGIIYSIFILGLGFYYFYIAPMPEVANRSAFWVVTTSIMLVSVTLLASSSTPLMLSATVILLAGLSVATYGIRNYRLVDIRETIMLIARTMAVVLISWSFIFAALYFLARIDFLSQFDIRSDGQGALIIAGLALGIAVLIVPARQTIDIIFVTVMARSRPNLATATAQYSQRVARAASLEDVVNATTEVLNRVMGVRQSALILINNTFRVPEAVELIVLEAGATPNNPTSSGYISKHSPIYRSLAVEKVPLGQFDIEYGPAFLKASDEERAFFKSLKMGAFVPVVADSRLIGLLASGAKINDTPYHRQDVEMLTVIGQQVGTALRSARLIDDLQHLNDSMRVLNKRLEGAKMELEKLDTIKTDFITIASHELRTPLAQIRGYTDIIDSLAEIGSLKPEQMSPMVSNLRKSTERMEELISAMLDVSQIDVNSMDLRFIRTTPETIVKMALEPLRDPASQRKIIVERHGLNGLPHVEADLQRMTQAFRNVILNAIKFTPDGGRIDIWAELVEKREGIDYDHILFKVLDTGVGIASKDIEFIFNKFYRGFDTQLHSTGIYKFMGAGPGLGLTIAKGIIEGHGGTLWAESPGHDMQNPPGSTFFIQLPLEPPSGTRRVLPFEGEDLDATQGIPDLRELEERPRSDEVNKANTRIPPSR